MSGSGKDGFNASVQGSAAVEVSLRDVVSSWLEGLYSRIPCNVGLVDLDVDDEGRVVGIWDLGTEEEPFVQTGQIEMTRKELAVMQIATHLMSVLDLPDKDRDFVPAYIEMMAESCGNGGEDGEDAVEGCVEENGMAGDAGEGMLRSESEAAD